MKRETLSYRETRDQRRQRGFKRLLKAVVREEQPAAPAKALIVDLPRNMRVDAEYASRR